MNGGCTVQPFQSYSETSCSARKAALEPLLCPKIKFEKKKLLAKIARVCYNYYAASFQDKGYLHHQILITQVSIHMKLFNLIIRRYICRNENKPPFAPLFLRLHVSVRPRRTKKIIPLQMTKQVPLLWNFATSPHVDILLTTSIIDY